MERGYFLGAEKRMEQKEKYPYAEVLVEFYPPENGGRRHPVYLDDKGYRPHFRILNETELSGVEFIEGPDEPAQPGIAIFASVKFLYWPNVKYQGLTIGKEF